MSYIITATFSTDDDVNHSNCLERVLKIKDVRHLSTENKVEVVDIRGNFFAQEQLTRKLCNDLIDSGIFRFNIDHSF